MTTTINKGLTLPEKNHQLTKKGAGNQVGFVLLHSYNEPSGNLSFRLQALSQGTKLVEFKYAVSNKCGQFLREKGHGSLLFYYEKIVSSID